MMFKELSGNALKVIAIVAMTIDHLAWVGIETYEQAETPTQIFLHCIRTADGPDDDILRGRGLSSHARLPLLSAPPVDAGRGEPLRFLLLQYVGLQPAG